MTAVETAAPGTTGGDPGAGPSLNHPGGLEVLPDIPRRESQTAAPEVVRETSPAPATPGSRPGDRAPGQDPK